MENLSVRHSFWFKMLFWFTIPTLHILVTHYQAPSLAIKLNFVTQLAWSFLVVGISFSITQFFQLFRSLRLSPRKSDPVILTLIIIAADLVANMILNIVVDIPNYFNMSLIFRSLALAGAWYMLGHALALILQKTHYRVRLGVFGSPEDLNYLRQAIKGFEAEKFLEIEMVNSHSSDFRHEIYVYTANQKIDENLEYRLIQLVFRGTPLLDIREVFEEFRLYVDLERNQISDVLQSVRKVSVTTTLYIRAKSVIEPILASFLFILLSPVLAITAALVKLSGPGPILFSQRRLSLGGREFTLYKFRTMSEDAESKGAQWSTAQDPRVTKIGHILRTLHLDELPQLFNIIQGEVSFVGPRPERPEFYEKLKQDIPLFYLRTVVRPGVTGWAQVFAGYANSVEGSRKKLAYDLHYIKGVSFRLDLISLVLTFVHIFNKFFLGEMALHDPTPTSNHVSAKDILSNTVLAIVLISVFTIGLSAIAFANS